MKSYLQQMNSKRFLMSLDHHKKSDLLHANNKGAAQPISAFVVCFNILTCFMPNFNILACLCRYTLLGQKPQNRLSWDEAHMMPW